jgi:protein-disulfide isomerase
MDSAETHDLIKAQASLGIAARVEGTPTIYVNGKKLPRGQLIPVLERVYQSLINP